MRIEFIEWAENANADEKNVPENRFVLYARPEPSY